MSAKHRPSLRFLGATGTVTGSRYIVETGGRRILVDCGLFQGFKQLRRRNRLPFPVAPESIDTVLLTHAHLDHSGYLPALAKNGFRGEILATEATAELCELILRDSGHLQEEEASYAARKGYSRHKNPKPLYTQKDAEAVLDQIRTVSFDQQVGVAQSVAAEFIPAGHLLGAAQIRLSLEGRTVHFTGDLGRESDPLMRPPRPFEGADVLICESTYGNRAHDKVDAEAELAPVINRVLGRGGTILVPSFAVGRAQGLMYHIARLIKRGEIPYCPVYLNSPMAIDATEIYHRHHDEHQVSWEDCVNMFRIAERVTSADESKALNSQTGPKVIISASGMLTGGRILHHLVSFGSDPRNAILISGFQAGGTRGAALAGGAQSLRIFGQEVPIGAEVVQLGSFSGHADANEILALLRHAETPPLMTYITHGEPEAADALRFRIDHELHWPVRVPENLETVSLASPE